MQIYILHGYVDGLTDPVVSTDYSFVYDAMKTAYEEVIDDAEQTPDELPFIWTISRGLEDIHKILF